MPRYKQDYYMVKNHTKYIGKNLRIPYRSSYELHLHQFFDNNPNVIQWGYESFSVPYIKPTDNRVHQYIPDYYVKYRNKHGEILEEVIECKPQSQTRQTRSRNPKYRLVEQVTYAINIAKWRACEAYCKKRNMKFRIVTERSIFA